MSGAERPVVDSRNQVGRQRFLAVEGPEPASEDRGDRIGVSPRTDHFGKCLKWVVSEAQEAKGGHCQRVHDKP